MNSNTIIGIIGALIRVTIELSMLRKSTLNMKFQNKDGCEEHSLGEENAWGLFPYLKQSY